MLWNRMDLKAQARENLRRNYGSCVLVSFIVSLLIGVSETPRVRVYLTEIRNPFFRGYGAMTAAVFMLLLAIFVISVFEVGLCRFYVENRDYEAPVSKLLFGFQCGHYLNVVKLLFLRDLKIFLWTLLFIIPGIIKIYEYRMIPYIAAEQPDLDSRQVFAISREMMRGQKFDAFILDLSFLLWIVATAFTCGLLGIFWVVPYMNGTDTELYVVLRNDWLMRHGGEQQAQGETK